MSHQHATAAAMVGPRLEDAMVERALVVPHQHADTHTLPGFLHQKIPCTWQSVVRNTNCAVLSAE